jgi:hypothetical protein
MQDSGARRDRPTFEEVFARIGRAGETGVTSSIGTEYWVKATVAQNGVKTLVATSRRGGRIRVHADCWGQDETCQGTRAGGLYHGSPSLFDLLA